MKKVSSVNKQIRCDICGRFISLKSFTIGIATRVLLTPDSLFTKETWWNDCGNHDESEPDLRDY